MSESLREKLATIAHEQWSGWMRYLFDCSQHTDDGVLIPPAKVECWHRQMETPYADLPESEKESDRFEADRILSVLTNDAALQGE